MATKKLKSKVGKSSAAESNTDTVFSVKNASKVIMEQAEHIWLAGLGAFSKAQEQGGKVFETLIKEGQALEKATRKLTTGKVDAARGAMETTVTQVRERASDTWDRLEKVFEDRVSKALNRLGVPGPSDLSELASRVEELSRAVRALESGQRGTKAKPVAVKAAPKAKAEPKLKSAPKAKAVVKTTAAVKEVVAEVKAAVAPAAKPRRAPKIKPTAVSSDSGN